MDIKKLTAKRGHIKAQITRFVKFLDGFDETKTGLDLKVRLDKIEPLWKQYNECQLRMEEIDPIEASKIECEEFEEQYFAVLVRAKQLIEDRDKATQIVSERVTTNSRENIEHNINCKSHVNLPILQLPEFTGKFEDYIQFENTFNTIITNNNSLNDIQRFFYLKSCLKADAAKIIQNLQVTETNYEVAWNLLKNRFDNKRAIINAHIKSLLELPNMTSESASALRNLLDNFQRDIRCLKALGQATEEWRAIVIYIVSIKFDINTRREWESSIKHNHLPSIDEFITFINHKCHFLEALKDDVNTNLNQWKSKSNVTKKSLNIIQSNVSTQGPICNLCKENHHLFYCNQFLNMCVEKRLSEVKRMKLCLNCLKDNHYSTRCNSSKCKICSKPHNTLLHLKNATETQERNSRQEDKKLENSGKVNTTINAHCELENGIVLLSTAVVYILDQEGNFLKCRALLDSGSQSNFITTNLVKRLKLQTIEINIPVIGINQIKSKITLKTSSSIQSIHNQYTITLDFLVLENITNHTPNRHFSTNQLNLPKGLELADPNFNESSSIDILLGASVFWDLLCADKLKLGHNQPIMQRTKLGWIVSGPIQFDEGKQSVTCGVVINEIKLIQDQLEQFWKIEDLPSKKNYSREEELCEESFQKTHFCDDTGRFTVKLPIRENHQPLGNNLELATKRFNSIERRFQSDAKFKTAYVDFMKEYQSLGHMTLINDKEEQDNVGKYYLPHHGVLKSDSITTKLRVVFDGSAKMNNISLNDILLKGPNLQEDIFSILVRFRKHEVVLIADIEKMYRQVNIHEDQRNLQRIVWRENPQEPLKHYQLNTITYGTTSAPFLAIRTLYQVALNSKPKFPLASETIAFDFYVDDFISGANSISSASNLKEEVETILQQSGFILRKWLSNKPVAIKNRFIKDTNYYTIGESSTKALGIFWDSKADTLKYSVNFKQEATITKRHILANISRIYDPLGLVSPILIKAKILLQELWKQQLDWDETVPTHIFSAFVQFRLQLETLNNIQIPRHVICEDHIQIQLHGFSDASEAAFGACIYLRSVSKLGTIQTSLLAAKSRVAPLKSISLPRLELCGAVLLARLAKRVLTALKLNITKTYYWIDSTIVLSWLAAESSKWKTFVANRVTEIQERTNSGLWRHVPSKENPADLITRGTDANTLRNLIKWWQGPEWLKGESESWPSALKTLKEVPEAKKCILANVSVEMFDIFSKYSSLNKLLKITAWCLRFFNNLKHKNGLSTTTHLTVNEIKCAERTLLKLSQLQSFNQEIDHIKKYGHVNNKSKIVTLTPFIDEDGILRVGGRLNNTNFNYYQKHQILLHHKHSLTDLIITSEHVRLLHAGPLMTLASIRTRFWIVNGRSKVRGILRKCIKCFKINPISTVPFMGDLPKHRAQPSRPFQICGVDYTGPFHVKQGTSRNQKYIKTYVCLFICFSTKAIHLELANDLSKDSFLNCLKRFISRRGLPTDVYSDNGTNFVGATNELKQIYQRIKQFTCEDEIKEYLLQNRIKWHFIPPFASNFGGLWEAAVKSCKSQLRKVVGESKVTYESLYTILVQIESILNSRPLTALSSDPNDLSPLTPAHFLIGAEIIALPQEDLSCVNVNRLSDFQKIQQTTQIFWKRWYKEYLTNLQQRNKWNRHTTNYIKPNTMVIIKEDGIPPLRWCLGRAEECFPGTDGIVRVALVRTKSGTIIRAVNKLCVLPSVNEVK